MYACIQTCDGREEANNGAGGGGGVGGRFTNGNEKSITDHRYRKFVFSNHENKQVRYLF